MWPIGNVGSVSKPSLGPVPAKCTSFTGVIVAVLAASVFGPILKILLVTSITVLYCLHQTLIPKPTSLHSLALDPSKFQPHPLNLMLSHFEGSRALVCYKEAFWNALDEGGN